MRKGISAIIVFGLIAMAGAATTPTTAPATYTISGHVKISGDLAIQRPDLTRVIVFFGADSILDAFSPKPGGATCAQQNKAFVPNFLAIPLGTSVEFPNWDHFAHNVFSRSAAAPAFDLDRYPYGQSKARVFDKVGVVQIFCNIHPYMKAIIFVAPNAFFTRADADGNFSISGVPAGRYQLMAWQERCGQQEQQVTVGPDAAQVSFALSENRAAVFANDPPSHANSYGVGRGLGIEREKLDLPVVTESHPAPTSQPMASGQ